MCFLAILKLAKMIDEEVLVKILERVGYDVEVRNLSGKRVIEARKENSILKASIHGEKVRFETNDYGSECLKDLNELYKALYEEDLKPEVIEVVSPYIYAREKKRKKTKKFLEELGIEVEEVYSGHCG